jgi:hypothetical protein
MSSSNVAIVPEYLDTGGGSISNIVITGINGIIVTEPTPGNFEISMTPLTVVGSTGITVTEPTPNNYSIASTITVTAGAGMTVSQPTPENFQVESNVGITGQNGIIVTQPTPSNFVVVSDPRVEVWFSPLSAPYTNLSIDGGGNPLIIGPLNLTGLPYVNPAFPVNIAVTLCGFTSLLVNQSNEFSCGIYDTNTNFITGFGVQGTSLVDVNWGPSIPNQLNFVSSFVSTTLSVLQTANIGLFLHFPPYSMAMNNLQVQVIVQYTN